VKHADHAIAYAHELGLIVNLDARGRRIDSDALARGVSRGVFLRLVPGVFVETARWQTASSGTRFTMRLAAVASTMSPTAVFSHATAAAAMGLPLLGAYPARLDITVADERNARSSKNLAVHVAPLADGDLLNLRGFLVTNPARTIADLARALPFTAAVATADAALRAKRKPAPLLTLDQLAAEAASSPARRGSAKLQRVIEFATPLSDSVRESQSRCLIHLAGFPAPVLQQEWHDARGLIGYTDFWWPDHDLIGEYDGLVKYLKERFRRGRTEAEVVIDEKKREDRLRALGPRVTRWLTQDLTPARLTAQLVGAGLPLIRAPRRA
jgi:hypothetical protein